MDVVVELGDEALHGKAGDHLCHSALDPHVDELHVLVVDRGVDQLILLMFGGLWDQNKSSGMKTLQLKPNVSSFCMHKKKVRWAVKSKLPLGLRTRGSARARSAARSAERQGR